MKWLTLKLIKLYQATLSYDHGYLGRIFPNLRFCKFTPTCSQYTYDAIDKYGIFKGSRMGMNRIGRCNHKTPMGTFDPVK